MTVPWLGDSLASVKGVLAGQKDEALGAYYFTLGTTLAMRRPSIARRLVSLTEILT